MTYVLVDSGDGRRLERVGPWLLNRQAPQAVWAPRLPAATWQPADAFHVRSDTGGGHWELRKPLPDAWTIAYGGLTLRIKPTPFGHLGVFPEQAAQWDWLTTTLTPLVARLQRDENRKPDILNLFAYTGGSTLACARAGAAVCHVDASKGSVDWARDHAALNNLADRPVRWIVDDCIAFLRREEKRGRMYDGIIMDPPSFGRGARGEVWKIEENLPGLLDLCRRVLTPKPQILLLSCHSPGFTPLVLANLLATFGDFGAATATSGEMFVAEAGSGRPLPSGAYARISARTAD